MPATGVGTFDDPILIGDEELFDPDDLSIVPDSEEERIANESDEDGDLREQSNLTAQERLRRPYRESVEIEAAELHEHRFQLLSKVLGRDAAGRACRAWLGKHPSSQRGEQKKYDVDCPICFEDVTEPNHLRFGICGHAAHEACLSTYIHSSHIHEIQCYFCRKAFPNGMTTLFHGSWLRPGPRELHYRLTNDKVKRARNYKKLSTKKKKRKQDRE